MQRNCLSQRSLPLPRAELSGSRKEAVLEHLRTAAGPGTLTDVLDDAGYPSQLLHLSEMRALVSCASKSAPITKGRTCRFTSVRTRPACQCLRHLLAI